MVARDDPERKRVEHMAESDEERIEAPAKAGMKRGPDRFNGQALTALSKVCPDVSGAPSICAQLHAGRAAPATSDRTRNIISDLARERKSRTCRMGAYYLTAI